MKRVSPLLLACFCGIFLACQNATYQNSTLFQDLFPDEETTLRGFSLGDQLDQARQIELPHTPRHADLYGLNYAYDLGENASVLIDYFPERAKYGYQRDRVVSIVANVLMPNEVETVRLYNEIQDYFNQKPTYGLPNGSFGDQVWNGSNRFISSMEVRLRIDEDKKGLTINFIDLQPGILSDSVLVE
ncbi:MAG: hypothetical protein AAFR61_31525 [Bacteroidota bacterium]